MEGASSAAYSGVARPGPGAGCAKLSGLQAAVRVTGETATGAPSRGPF
jgi:hypothetical protein